MKRTQNLMVGVLACVIAAAMLALPAREASGQSYFRDDFDGDAFKPNWVTPPPEHWDYEIGGGELTVNQLKWPGQPFGNNFSKLSTPIDPMTGDWSLTVGLEWDTWVSGGARVLAISSRFTGITLIDAGPDKATLEIGHESKSLSFGVSTADYLTIGLNKVGSEFYLFYNGTVLGSLPQTGSGSISELLFTYQNTYPWGMAPIRLDFVEVIPGVPTLVPVAGVIALNLRRRRN